ncbi:MAG: hypothetical protein Q8L45_14375 [Xanthomonadaceae bacterium]|nr:hypothetical protein [Xanthomonadaceae bacterium]MDP2183881.1 hypothetical protein [Xanthomonadales bacterium]MDZ4114984.1 hypothetical protein [Xanthomonadaceae bacterium]MDZ4379308.1 hypothetical protein [Xanthomonadaceae bacterium]
MSKRELRGVCQRAGEIARDVARKLIAARDERAATTPLAELQESFDYPLVLG